jgi:hypothetical protein
MVAISVSSLQIKPNISGHDVMSNTQLLHTVCILFSIQPRHRKELRRLKKEKSENYVSQPQIRWPLP